MHRLTILLIAFTTGFQAFGNGNVPVNESSKENYNRTVGFEKNLGQVGDFEGNPVPEVLLKAKLPGYGIFISSKGISYVLYQIEKMKTETSDPIYKSGISGRETSLNKSINLNYARFDVELVGADINSNKIEFEDPLTGYTNYYLVHCPDGVLGVLTYRAIRIKEVYPGIDWVWRHDGVKMHHEFEVAPGADHSMIKMKVAWADVELLDEGRKIAFSTPLGKIEDGEILAYEMNPLAGKIVDVSYKNNSDGTIGYEVRNYTGSGKLIIDPPLSVVWSTYYGGDQYDEGYSIITDDSGNIFVTGITGSDDFPVHDPGNGAYFQGTKVLLSDAFILKFSNDGVRQWATYYGGSSQEFGRSIAADGTGNVFITGETRSADFPIFDPGNGAYFHGSLGSSEGYDDVYILKFNNAGERLWGTYYGGSSYDYSYSIATDNTGNVFITGTTNSNDLPVQNPGGDGYFQESKIGQNDIFILKFSNTGVLQWATYYGGEIGNIGRSITTDIYGNVFITGETIPRNFPVQQHTGGVGYFQGDPAGGWDAFILKFTNAGTRVWATLYGGSDQDYGRSITTDISGNVIVTGETYSVNLPVLNPGDGAYFQGSLAAVLGDVFILKFSNTSVRQWATYYGGSNTDNTSSVTVDDAGNIYVTGHSRSADLPTYDPGGSAYFQGTNAGGLWDAYILKFTNDGEQQWATYYGGSNYDMAYSICAYGAGYVFVTGTTLSDDFPLHNPGGNAYYRDLAAAGEVFILKFGGDPTGVETVSSTVPTGYTLHQNFPNPFNPSTTIQYDLPDASHVFLEVYNILGQRVAVLVDEYRQAGNYSVVLNAENLPSGVYAYRLRAGDFTEVRKLLLAR